MSHLIGFYHNSSVNLWPVWSNPNLVPKGPCPSKPPRANKPIQIQSTKNPIQIEVKQKIKTKSPCQVLRDLAGFTAVFSVLQSVLFFILFPFVLPHWLDLPPYIVLIWGAIICCVTWIIIEFILATFVLVQLRRQSINQSRSSTVSLDFERLVALVALVFCCNLIVNVIVFY